MTEIYAFDIIFLPVILFIGIITSYEDFKSSNIKNKWVFVGLIYALLTYLLFYILSILISNEIISSALREVVDYLLSNFHKWCINLVISVLVGYYLWHFKMWGAGDAKLFIAYAALIPMGQYSKVYFNYYFASFLLLLSIFMPATIFLFLKAIFSFLKRLNLNDGRKNMAKLMESKIHKFKIGEWFKILLGFFVFFLFVRILKLEVRGLLHRFMPNQNMLTLVSLIAFRHLSKIFKKKSKFTLLFLIIFSFYVLVKIQDLGFGYLSLIANSLNRSILIVLLFPVVNKIIHIYEENTIRKTTPFAFWMFLGALITWFI